MTSPECPVCATPYEAGAESCAFCGVSLVEPTAKLEAKSESEPEPEAAAESPPVAEPGASAEESSPPEPAVIASPEARESEPDEAPTDEVPVDEASLPAPAAITEVTEIAETTAIPVDEAGPETAQIAAIPAAVAMPAPRTRMPSFMRKPTAAGAAQRRARRIEWGVVAGLVVLLVVQSVASDFDQLAGNATTRPWLQGLCGVLRCTLPAWREPDALHLLQRDVRANPDHPGLLRISASFRNDARWAQAWPRLRVTLSDADGRAIAARDFSANEYLGTTPTANGIASGQVAGVAVDVIDPSPRVTAFTFEFR